MLSRISLDVIAPISVITGVIAGSLLTQYYRKRNLYSDPYITWCVSAFGTIKEFKEMYDYIETNYNLPVIVFSKVPTSGPTNPIFIISHLWEMHREVEKGYKWLGQIRKLDPCAAVAFNSLFDDVDNLWHYLEEKYNDLLGSQTSSDDFRKILKKYM